jgi:hypothetical protein
MNNMKKIVNLLVIMASVWIYTSCYDRDIIDVKDGVSLPPVSNLNHSLSDNKVIVTWLMPSEIPSEMNRPLGVNIQVLRCQQGSLTNVRVLNETIPDEPTEATLAIPSNPDDGIYEYHIVVKLTGTLKDATYGYSNTIYSLGQTIVLK